jgi:hypothetical protein
MRKSHFKSADYQRPIIVAEGIETPSEQTTLYSKGRLRCVAELLS